ncbi:MAG: hypothetical protein KAH35_03295 [Candidatus Atribacteria bacterium]|nr:hypothetical protein [Candidatus Atribacteria bacterium]
MKSLSKLVYVLVFISILFISGCSVLPELPDLVITQVDIGSSTVSFQIVNQGDSESELCQVCLLVNGILESKIIVPGLLPGASVDKNFSYNYVCSGEEDIILVTADCEDQVAEKEESNNDYQISYSCGVKLVLPTLSAEDGFLLQNNLFVYSSPQVGDTANNKATRAFLSFDISSIPPGSYIISAELNLNNITQVHEPEFDSLGHFEIYFYEYGNFSDLDSSDFDAPGILVKGGRISNYPLNPWYVDVIQSWDGVNTEPYFQNLVNAGKDRCQFKLQFSELTDMDSSTDIFGLENVNLKVVYLP